MLKSSELVSPVSFPATSRAGLPVLVKSEWAITALLVLIAGLPTLALWNRASYLTGDSYQYLRAATTFANGQGLRDMSGGPFTFLTPLYPVLIGIAYRLAPGVSIETTARLISLAGATTAVIAFYWLLRVRHSLWISFSASLLFALLPLRVWSGLWALSEGLFLGLLMLGLAVLFRPAKTFWFRSALGGVLLGLAYLTRPEAMLCVAAIAALFFFKAPQGKKRALVILFSFLTIAVPYHARVYQATGHLSSGRLSLLFTQSESFKRGLGPQFVYSHEVSRSGTSVQEHTPDMSVRAVLTRYAFFARWEANRLVYDLGPYWIVVFLLVVGFVGLALLNGGPLKGFVFDDTWQLVLLLMLFVLPLLHIEDRYLLQALPVFLLWLTLIVIGIYRFFTSRLSERSKLIAALIPLSFISLFVLSYGTRLFAQVPERDSSALARGTAHWLESQNLSAASILSQTPDLAFFSSAQHLWMPGGEPDHVVMYAQQNGARYIYVSSQDASTPLNELLLGSETQIPASLQLLHEETDGSARGRLFELKSANVVVSSHLHL